MDMRVNAPRLRAFLHQALVSDLVTKRGSITVVNTRSDSTLASALKALQEYDILSLPVKGDNGDYIGFIDVLDILTNTLLTYSDGEDTTSMQWSDWCRDVNELVERGEEFGTTPVGKMMNVSHADKWCPVEDGTLYQLIEVFSRGIHRVPIITGGRLQTLVSQSDFVQVLDKYMRQELLLDEFGPKTLRELGLGQAESLVTMSIHAQAIHAFWSMYFQRVMAVAVVDSDGKLIGNISASDIRGIGGPKKNFATLLLPVDEFASLQGPARPPVTCTLDTPIERVIHLLAEIGSTEFGWLMRGRNRLDWFL